MLTQGDLSAIQKVVKKEVQGVEERLSTKLNKANESLGAKITKVQETIDIVQNVVVKHHGKLEQRVVRIEEELHASRN